MIDAHASLPAVQALTLAGAGALVGSFLGLVSVRLPQGRGVVRGRSQCGGCGRTLGPADLIPVVSFLASRGRCRTCGVAIPRRYPLIEAGSAGLGLIAGALQPDWAAALLTALLLWQLLLLAVVDAENFWLPDVLTLPLAATGLAATSLLTPFALPLHLAAAVGGWLALEAIRRLYRRLRGREGMGGGDPILFGAIGAWTGPLPLPFVLLWAAAGGLAVAAALATRKGGLRADLRLPFGVFLALGCAAVWLLGPR